MHEFGIQETWGDTKSMSIHRSGFHIFFLIQCHCQKPDVAIQWQLALSLIFKPSLRRNLMSYYVLQWEWDIIFTTLSTLRSIYTLLRKMTVLKLKKWLSPIATHRGWTVWTSVPSRLTLNRRWARAPHQPHAILKKVGAKIMWTWVTTAPQVAVTILCRLCNCGGF